MPLELTDVRKMKAEARRDLEAIERVEAILLRQSPNGKPAQELPINPDDNASKLRLTETVIAVVRESKEPLRPIEIVEHVIARGYPFSSPRQGLGSVTKVLVRQMGKTLTRLANGTYVGIPPKK
jgi:hypothetical protein